MFLNLVMRIGFPGIPGFLQNYHIYIFFRVFRFLKMRNLIPSKNDQARFSIHPLPFLVNLNVLLSSTIFTGDRGGGG